MVAGNSAFFLLLDKKVSEHLDYATTDSDVFLQEVSYHYTDVFDSRITYDKIGFVDALATLEKRLHKAQEAARSHYVWKIQAASDRIFFRSIMSLHEIKAEIDISIERSD